MIIIYLPEHGDHDLLVLWDRPHTHPHIGVLHGGLPPHGITDHPPGLPGPDDGQGRGLPVRTRLQPQLIIGGGELELAGPLVDPVESLPDGAHGGEVDGLTAGS